MTGIFEPTNSGERQTLFWVLSALGVYWAELIYQLGAQWSIYEQYSYGWAVPFLCAYLAWQRMRAADGETKPASTSFHLPSSIIYLLVVFSALLYAPTRFFHEANPVWRLTSLLWALEVVVLTLAVIRLALNARRLPQLAFPVCFFLVAVPWPSGLEFRLVQFLTHLNVSATVEVLGWFGIPALQHGNVIEVATGEVGIDEACSGIRSFQATLMISLFFGEFYRLNVMRRVTCVLAGFVLSFLFNLSRTTLLTWVAAKKGVPAIAAWHDPAGVTILVACFLALWLVALGLRGKNGKQKSEVRSQTPEVRSPTFFLKPQVSTVRRLAIALLVWFILVEAGVQWWYRTHERAVAVNRLWMFTTNSLGSGFAKVEIPPGIQAQFRADENMEEHWRDDAGNAWQLYYFRWLPAHSLNKRVAIQLAKTHGPETCLPAIGMTLKSDLGIISVPVGDLKFVFRQYLFLADGQPLHVFYAIYEDPTGSTVLANRRMDTASRIAAALAGSRNDGQRFLELAVAGPQNPETAQSELRGELEKLIISNQ